jgi:hypothetical protein
MKKEVAAYVVRCDMCCRVKALHMRPAVLLQPLSVPDWKWDDISMDFITGLPTTPKGNDLIWVIVDRLNMRRSILLRLSDYMVYRRLSCLTVVHSLPLIFGSIFIKGWVLV